MYATSLRRAAVWTTIGSFSVAALMGIAALLSGGAFGEVEGNILLTTFLVGVLSVAMLTYLAVSGSEYAPLGLVGAIAAAFAFTVVQIEIWGPGIDIDELWKATVVAFTVAATLSQICLLLALGLRAPRWARYVLAAAVLLASLLALLIIIPILLEPAWDNWYWRVLGVIGILDALATLVLVAARVFSPIPAGRPPASDAARTTALDPRLEAWLAHEAARRGVSPSSLLDAAVRRYLEDTAGPITPDNGAAPGPPR